MADTPREQVQLLRQQIAALLSHLDTATLPAPDVVRSRRDDRPGCEWRPAQGWRVLTAEGDPADAGAGCVYLDHTCDDMASGWGIPGDWEAMRI